MTNPGRQIPSALRGWLGIKMIATVAVAALQLPASSHAFPGPIRSQTPAPDALPCAVTLGGIGCGGFDLLPNGRFARAVLNNNWERPIETMPGCFAAIWTRSGGNSEARVLSTVPEYGLPGTDTLQFESTFPRAVIGTADKRIPVGLTLRAYSSLVPQDIKNSSVPAAILLFTLKNELDAPIEASVAVSWENLLGLGGSAVKGPFGDRTGNRLEMLPPRSGVFGIKMSSPERQIADPLHRLYYNARGTYALLAAPTSPNAVVTLAGWNARDARPGWWRQFAEEGKVESTVGAGVEGSIHPAGVLAQKVTLRPRESLELPFVVAWHTPRHYAIGGAEYGHYYEKSFDDAVEVGRYALDNRQSALGLLDEWQNRLLRSSLPTWLTRGVMNHAGALFSRTTLTRDSGVGGTEPGPYRFAVLDGNPGSSAVLSQVETRFAAQGLLLSWFPELDLRELQAITERMEPTGRLPASLGDLEGGFSTAASPAPTPASTLGAAGSPSQEVARAASFAFQTARRFRTTGDQRFLDRFYPHVKHALESEGVRSAQFTGRAREWWKLASSIGRYLAQVMRDRGFERTCSEWLDSGIKGEAIDPIAPESLVVLDWMASSVQLSWPTRDQRRATLIKALNAGAGLPSSAIDPLIGLFAGSLLAREGDPKDYDAAIALIQKALSERDAATFNGMSSAGSWHALEALTGVVIDLPSERLTLAPVLPAGTGSMNAPVFAPTFWANLEFHAGPSSARLTFRLDRMMPAHPAPRDPKVVPKAAGAVPEFSAGLTLREVTLPTRNRSPVSEVTASVGRAPVPGTLTRAAGGQPTFVFSTPLTLIVGQSLVFQIR